jgi:H+/Cl- antiporter ClcA
VAGDSQTRPGRTRSPYWRWPTTRTAPAPTRDAPSGARWWSVVVLAGVAAGLIGIAITELLHLAQHIAFGYTEDTFLHGVEHASPSRRLVVLLLAGLVAGVGWWLLRRRTTLRSVGDAIADPSQRLPMLSTTLDGCLQVIVVGLGASLGREGAPRQIAAAAADRLGHLARLDPARRRTLIAAGAGAGLAAVYNVPIGGCLFAVEVLLGAITLATVVPAAVCSAIAVVTSWLVLPRHATYQIQPLHLSASVMVFAAFIGPITGLAAVGFDTMVTAARGAAPRTGWRLLIATLVSFGALGCASIAYPQLLGNGKGPTELALTGSIGLGSAAILTALKPAATAACLRSGASGGLLTPSLATGALLGCVTGQAWQLLWPGGQTGAFAFVAAAAMLASTQRAPLCAAALMIELTHTGYTLIIPLALAITGALITSRWLSSRTGQHRVEHSARSDTARWADGSESDPNHPDTGQTSGEGHPIVVAQAAECRREQADTPAGEVTPHTGNETLDDIVTRLCGQHPEVDPATIRRMVAEAYRPLTDSPIRGFVPILVEQTANRALTSSRS